MSKPTRRAPYGLAERPCPKTEPHRAHFSSLAAWCFGVPRRESDTAVENVPSETEGTSPDG